MEKVDTSASNRSQAHFIDHSFSSRFRVEDNNVGIRDVEAGEDMSELRDWRVKPKTPRRKDKTVAEIIVNRRKGEPLAVILDKNSDGISSETQDVLEALYEDVNSEVKRKSVDEKEQLEWLVEEYVSDLAFLYMVPKAVFVQCQHHVTRQKTLVKTSYT